MDKKRKRRTDNEGSAQLAATIAEGMLKRKAREVVTLDLSKLNNAVCNYFVICHGTSRTQLEAIADAVQEEVLKHEGGKPWHKEGFENAEWILLDYVDVVVHIFRQESRDFYQLEKLWADAKIKHHTYKE